MSVSRPSRTVALVLGASLVVAYAAFVWLTPRGPHEFAYAPFSLRPLPYAPMRGFTYEQLWGHVTRALVLGPAILLLVVGLMTRVRLRAPPDVSRVCLTLAAVSVALTAFLMLVVLRGRAITDDELAYAMQASFYGAGRATGPHLGVTLGDFFNVTTPHGYLVKYLPGEPLLQTLGVKLGIPALMHLPLFALMLWAWYRTFAFSLGARRAWLVTAALACSPMLIFTAATGLSHLACLASCVLMGLGVERARQGSALKGALLAGAAFGGGVLIRPQGVAPVALALGLALVASSWRQRSLTALVGFALSATPGVVALLWYNDFVTGSPFKLPWSEQCDAEHFGFGRVWLTSTYEHTLERALENLAVVALRLNSWWLGLPISLAVLAAFAWACRREACPAAARPWLWSGVSVIVFELFYYSTGASDTGAIYHFELLLPGSLVAALVADALLSRAFGALAITLSLTLGTGSWVVEQGLRLQRLVSTIHADADLALARISAPALIIHEELDDEVVRRGWVFSSFPRRFRGLNDDVVTLPRVSTDLRARAERVYPRRKCWYFRHLPGRPEAELRTCDDAELLLERPIEPSADARRRVYWERPTAYREAGYDPFRAIFEDRARDARGRLIVPCCALRRPNQTQPQKLTGEFAPCIETGQ